MTREEARKFGLQLLHGIMERNESYPVYANNIKQAINALSEESSSSGIPNDLEDAAYKYTNSEAAKSVGRAWVQRDVRLSFIAGAEWQKDKMLKLIETRISEIIGDAQPNPVLRIELQSIIDKIK